MDNQNASEEQKNRNRANLFHILNTLLGILTSVAIPLCLQFTTYETTGNGTEGVKTAKNTTAIHLAIIAILLFLALEYFRWQHEKCLARKQKDAARNERAKTVLIQIVQLIDRKADNYRKNTYDLKVVDKEWPYIYGVHNYLHEVCDNLKVTIAKIIHEESSQVDVSLIYRYCSETNWKWLAGRSGLSDMVNLNEFIKDSATLYYYVLHHKEKAPVFSNNKLKSDIYKLGRRDNLFGGKGSYYAMPITFCNNQEALVEAILMISTYGVNFLSRYLPARQKRRSFAGFWLMKLYRIIFQSYSPS